MSLEKNKSSRRMAGQCVDLGPSETANSEYTELGNITTEDTYTYDTLGRNARMNKTPDVCKRNSSVITFGNWSCQRISLVFLAASVSVLAICILTTFVAIQIYSKGQPENTEARLLDMTEMFKKKIQTLEEQQSNMNDTIEMQKKKIQELGVEKCLNGFRNDEFQNCSCEPGYTGEFCEYTVTELEYHVGDHFEWLSVDGQVKQLSRGFHVLIYNEVARTWTDKSYDSHQYEGLYSVIVPYIDNIPRGKLLLFATSDDASKKMEKSCKDYLLTGYNSLNISGLLYRGAWILVGVKGGPKLLERLYNGAVYPDFPEPTILRFQILSGNSEYLVSVH